MKIKGLLFLLLICTYSLFGQVVYVTDYGASPDNPSDDDQQAIRDAITQCASLSNPVLSFPVGTYHVNSANGSGNYFNISIPNLTIEGNGSTIEVLGTNYSRRPFSFTDCDNLLVKNITVDYDDPPASQGKIISTSSNSMDIQLFDGFSPVGKSIVAYAQYDSITGNQVNNNESYSGGNWSWLNQSQNIIRLNNNNHGYSAGMFILLRHTLYTGYSFAVNGGKDIVFDGAKVKLSPGYAFIATGSENVTYRNCRIEKKAPNFWATTNADGSHDTDIRGNLLFDNCYFEHMCDDGINLHSIYLNIIGSNSNSISLQGTVSYYNTKYYRVGDTLEFQDNNALETHAASVIANITSQNGNAITVELAGGIPSLPNPLSQYRVQNISALGALTVTNCTFHGNRARGVLVNTRKVLIENCTFDRTMMTGILFQLSPTSNEPMPARDVTIRNNIFNDCYHYKTGTDYGIIDIDAGETASQAVCGIFENISITGNTFRNIRVPAVYAKHVDQIEIKGNTIESAASGRNLIRFGESNYPVVENNIGAVPDNMGNNCTPGVSVTSVSLSPTSATLLPDEELQLTASVIPSNAPDVSLVWLSDNTSIATVNASGLVRAVAEGFATITAITNDGSFTASTPVIVNAAPVGTNVALNKAITYSTVQSPYDLLTDGNIDDESRWTANSSYTQWVQVDLGANYNLNQFEVYPYRGRDYQYTIDVSTDGSNYSTAVDRSSNTTGGIVIIDEAAVSGRYVKVTITGAYSYTGTWVSLNELMVYGVETGGGGIVQVTGVTVDQISASLEPSQTLQLTETVSPTDASDKSVSWASDNTAVATVDANGLVTAVAEGSANITVTTTDGAYTDVCVVNVAYDPPCLPVTIQAEDAMYGLGSVVEAAHTGFNGTGYVNMPSSGGYVDFDIDGCDGGDFVLSYRYALGNTDRTGSLIINGTSQSLTMVGTGGWTNYQTVDVNITLNAGAVNTIRFESTGQDLGNLDEITLTYSGSGGPVGVTGVSVSPATASLEPTQTQQLSATVSPVDATDPSVTWTSDNELVATVDANGLVTAVANGTANITVTTNDGGFSDVCAVTVTTSVTGVSVSPTSASLEPGQTQQLSETVSPTDATDKSVSWASDNTAVATVDANGLVTAVANGTANITVTTNDGGFSDVCAVTVTTSVTGVSVSPTSASLEPGQTQQLSETVSPTDATDKSVSWASDNTAVATVDANGLVTAVADGIANITATTNDGDFTAICAVTVNTPLGNDEIINVSGPVEVSPGESISVHVDYEASASRNIHVVLQEDGGAYAWFSNRATLNVSAGSGSIDALLSVDAAAPAGIDAYRYLVYITPDTSYGWADRFHSSTQYGVDMLAANVSVTGVSVSPATASLEPTQTQQLTATVSPVDATDPTVTWTSDNVLVATVDTNGLVTAVADGTANITVTTTDGSYTAVCVVTVSTPATCDPITIQAENAVYGGGADINSNHTGFNGSGYINMPKSGGYVEFTVDGCSGGDFVLSYRYALGNADRTGILLINGVSQSLTMASTGSWRTYLSAELNIQLNSGNNTIRFETNGEDFGNLDEITVTEGLKSQTIERIGDTNIRVYPNPAYDLLSIEFDNENKNAEVIIADLSGKVLLIKSLKEDMNSLDLSTLNKGVYFMFLKDANKVIDRRKIVKIK